MLAQTGGTLIDGTGVPSLVDAVALIEDGRFACAGTKAQCDVSSAAQRLDVTGYWLTPGLIDGHVHVAPNGWMDTRPKMTDVTDK